MEDWFFAIECGSVFERLCLSSAWVPPFSFQLSLGSYFLFNAHLSFRRNVFWSTLWWLYFGGVDAQRRKLERNGFEVHLWLCWFCERSSHVFQTKRSDAKVNLANACDEIREDKTAKRVRKCFDDEEFGVSDHSILPLVNARRARSVLKTLAYVLPTNVLAWKRASRTNPAVWKAPRRREWVHFRDWKHFSWTQSFWNFHIARQGSRRSSRNCSRVERTLIFDVPEGEFLFVCQTHGESNAVTCPEGNVRFQDIFVASRRISEIQGEEPSNQ